MASTSAFVHATGTPAILFNTTALSTVVGSGTILNDGSDSTYVQTATNASGSRGVVECQMEALDASIDASTVTDVIMHFRCSADAPGALDLRFVQNEGSSGTSDRVFGVGAQIALTTTPTDYTFSVKNQAPSDPVAAATALKTPVWAWLTAQTGVQLRYYEVSVEVVYVKAAPVGGWSVGAMSTVRRHRYGN